LDIFSGTGSTGEVALRLKRKYIGYEVNPEFLMGSIVRLKEFIDIDPVEFLKIAS
jgi:DNA modification methylase